MLLRGLPALLVTVVLVAVTGPAQAALWLSYSPTSGRPGVTVEARTVGSGAAINAAGGRLEVMLGDDQSLGWLEVDARGDGRLRFTLPDVAPGAYDVWIVCGEPCGDPPGEWAPVGSFLVLAAAGGDGAGVWPAWLAVAAATALAAVWVSRRRARPGARVGGPEP